MAEEATTTTTEATTQEATTTTTAAAAPAAAPGAEAMQALIDLAKKQPGVVPELITGSTPAEVNASIANSQAVYARLVAQVQAGQQAAIPGAGGGQRPPVVLSPGYSTIKAGIDQEGGHK